MKKPLHLVFLSKKKKKAHGCKEGGTCLFVRGIFGMFICEQTTDDRVSIWEWKKKTQSLYRIPIEGSERGWKGFIAFSLLCCMSRSRCGRTEAEDEDVDKLDIITYRISIYINVFRSLIV